MPVTKKVVVLEKDTVHIVWHLFDGTIYEMDVTVPPKETREARRREQCEAAD